MLYRLVGNPGKLQNSIYVIQQVVVVAGHSTYVRLATGREFTPLLPLDKAMR